MNTPEDVQAKIDAGLSELKRATASPAKIVLQYGSDPAKWPTGHLRNAATYFLAARTEVGQLGAGSPTAAFTFKEV